MENTFKSRFAALTKHLPFRWQQRLYQRLVAGDMPSALDLPTGLGKTSVMTIWLLARAVNPSLPRRLVYVVDRRAVVDQASAEAEQLRNQLAQDDMAGLRAALGMTQPSLAVSTLRGRLADNRQWLADPAAPAIIVGTIDMIGSRLLFEGYGVSRGMRPFHAGLLGADSLFVIDEAHLCPPFEALLKHIETEADLKPDDENDRQLIPPLRLLSLSATGRQNSERAFPLEPADREDALVTQRLDAQKSLSIEAIDTDKNLAEGLSERAWQHQQPGVRVLVYCNRRKDAQAVMAAIEKIARREKIKINSELLVGARRAYERESLSGWLNETGFKAGSEQRSTQPVFLIATSAGEVGIDLDADHMVCDLVPFERMVQRFGRVNRRGGGERAAQIDVLTTSPIEPSKPADNAKDKEQQKYAVAYEKYQLHVAQLGALKALQLLEHDRFDASPGAINHLKHRSGSDPALARTIQTATTPEPSRPALSRALVDAWAMTSLREHPGRSDIAPWLRGWVDDEPQTTVAWREYLPCPEDGRALDSKEVTAFFRAAPLHITELLETRTSEVYDWLLKRAKESDQAGVIALVLNAAGEYQSFMTVQNLRDIAKNSQIRKQQFLGSLIGQRIVIRRGFGGLDTDGLLDQKAKELPMTLDADWPALPRCDWRVRYCPV
ncbi:MAG: type I-U CRISPR-associated helicase/endonuclease Cas3 [Gammaproteobacteria bacterium]|nr:type I-U CRISPR-associated helicase/endonuclease Cas3 [Gammaproteobacteria bacterium]